MSTTKPRIPAFRRHKQSGQAVVTLADGVGGRRDVLLGTYGTKKSKDEYKRVVLEWESNDRRLPDRVASADMTAGELLDRYWQHAQGYYRRADGTETQEVTCIKYSLRALNYLHGASVVKDFGPVALKAVRELMGDRVGFFRSTHRQWPAAHPRGAMATKSQPQFMSVSQIAREHKFAPRKLSDLFYARKLDDAKCPIVNHTRIIPADYLPEVIRVLREVGLIAKGAA